MNEGCLRQCAGRSTACTVKHCHTSCGSDDANSSCYFPTSPTTPSPMGRWTFEKEHCNSLIYLSHHTGSQFCKAQCFAKLTAGVVRQIYVAPCKTVMPYIVSRPYKLSQHRPLTSAACKSALLWSLFQPTSFLCERSRYSFIEFARSKSMEMSFFNLNEEAFFCKKLSRTEKVMVIRSRVSQHWSWGQQSTSSSVDEPV